MRKQVFWWLGIGVLTLALVGQYAAYSSERVVMLHATWALQPDSLADVTNAANTVITGRVDNVQPGPDLVVTGLKFHAEDRIPTERVTITVESSEKGNAQVGQQVTVFRTGGQRQRQQSQPQQGGRPDDPRNNTQRLNPPGGGKPQGPDSPAPAPQANNPEPAPQGADAGQQNIYLLPEDPPYQQGARVFLALEDGPDNTKRPVHPAGRYRIGQNNRLEAVGDDPVSRGVNGREVAEAVRVARGQGNINSQRPQLEPQRRVTTEGEPGMPRTGTHGHEQPFQFMIFFWIGCALVVLGVSFGILNVLGTTLRRVRKS